MQCKGNFRKFIAIGKRPTSISSTLTVTDSLAAERGESLLDSEV